MLSIAIKRWIKRIILVLVVISVTILAIRIYDTQRGPKLGKVRISGEILLG